MHISAAIVEDEKTCSDLLSSILRKYGEKNDLVFSIRVFSRPAEFLSTYKPTYDVVFMDIEMPGIDGIKTSEQLRKLDQQVLLVFVTNLAQFAIKGYDVGAFGFIVKPISYPYLEIKLRDIVRTVEQNQSDQKIVVKIKDGTIALRSDDILYVETENHRLIYHTTSGDYATFAPMAKAEGELPKASFALCNQSFLVNLKYVTMIAGMDLHLGKVVVPISRPKKRSFIEAFTAYVGRHL